MKTILHGLMVLAVVAGCGAPGDEPAPDAATEPSETDGVIYAFGSELQKLRPNVSATTVFGTALAIEADTLVVGATVEGGNEGRVYVFIRTGSTWTLQQKLSASDPSPVRFGISVAISGDTLIAGRAGEAGNPQQGAAYVFVRSGTTWSQQQKITAPDGAAQDRFGQVVRLAGDTAVIGAPGDDQGLNPDVGSAYVFVRSGTTWSQQQKLAAADGQAGDQFGYGVTIEGNTVAIGARRDDDVDTDAGSVYVFVRSGTTWSQQQKLTSDSGNDGNFGREVSLSGETLLIGAMQRFPASGIGNGAAYVFVRSGTTWSQQQKLTASDGANQDLFGADVALFGDTAAIGARMDDDGAPNTGSIYIFKRNGTTWTQDQKVKPTDGQNDDRFSQDMALFGTTLVGGSRGDDDLANASGAAYVFESPIVTNGSFETANYNGWTLQDISVDPAFGIYGIANDGQTIDPGTDVFDFADGVTVNTGGTGPITYDATDGTRVAFQIQPNGPPPPESHRMFQTITIPTSCAAQLRWDMTYNSFAPLDDASQFTAVNVRNVGTDAILATPFKAGTGAPQTIATMTAFVADLSAFAGQTVRLDFEHRVLLSPFQIAWDSIRIECVVAPPTSAIAIDPTSHDFGNQRVGTTSTGKTFTITNTGTAPLTITAITTTGPFATANTPIVVAPSATANISVTFTPTAPGPDAGTLTITSDATNDPSLEVPLSGTGVQPAISVDQGSIAFADQNINTVGTRALVVTNTGTDTLTISGLSADSPFAVSAADATPIAIAPGNNRTLAVRFAPTAVGPFSGDYVIASDATNSPITTVGLTGTGVEPLIQVVPASVSFGNQRVNTTGFDTVVVTNTGSGILTISALAAGGAFAVLNSAPIAIAPGDDATLNVSFTPTGLGAFSDSLTITSDAASSPTVVGLSGTGIAPQLTVQGSLAFGNQRINTTGNQSLLILNTGSDTLTITAISTTAGYVDNDPTPLQILSGGQATLTVSFTPTADGLVNGSLTIVSDDAASPTSVLLSGVGVSPTIATDGQVPFGDQRVGTTSAGTTLLVTNGGSDTLTISAINVTAPFASVDGLPITIGPSSDATLTFTFTPGTSGSVFQLGQIVSDAANAPVVNIALTGTGVEPIVSLQNTPIFFGNRRVGTSASRFFTLENSGNTDLVVTGLSIPAPFSVIGATSFTLAPAVPRVVEVQFSPTAVGPATQSLTLTSDATTSPDTFTVSGIGTVPGLTPSATSLAFGTVKTGTQSLAQTFTLTNTGDASASITATNVPANFTLVGPPLPISLLPDGQATFSVTFDPIVNGAAGGDITFTSDASLVPTIAVGGTGGTPMMNPSPTSVSFGVVAVGATSDAQTVTLSNVSDLPVVISDIFAAAPFVRTSLAFPVTVPAGGQLSVGVLFSPTQGGLQNGALMVNSDAGPLAIPLDGEGLDLDAPPGSGCCSTSSDSGSAFVFALLLVPLLRRRRPLRYHGSGVAHTHPGARDLGL